MRKSRGMSMYKDGVPVEKIAKVLNHSNTITQAALCQGRGFARVSEFDKVPGRGGGTVLVKAWRCFKATETYVVSFYNRNISYLTIEIMKYFNIIKIYFTGDANGRARDKH